MSASSGAQTRGQARRQDSSDDNKSSNAAPTALGETSNIEYGTALFRTSDIAFSDAVLRKVTDPVHIAHVAFDLPNKLGNQYSWVLLLAPSHNSFLKAAEQVRCAANRLTFLMAYNRLATHTLQHYVYQRLQYIFSEFSDVGHVFIDVDSAQPA